MTPTAKFAIGSLVQHNKFNYRGVVVDVDPEFMLSEEWYEQVAERHLEADTSQEPIRHPLVDEFFSGFSDGHYQTGQRQN